MSSADVSGRPPSQEQIAVIVMQEAEISMRRGMLVVEAEWKKRALPSRQTGTYMRSITTRVTRTGSTVEGRIGSALDYARYLEYGTGVHGPRNRMIVPKRAKVLRFPSRGSAGFTLAGRQRSGKAGAAAQWVYRPRVRGIRPRRYARDAAMIAQPKVIKVFEEGGRRAAMRIAALHGK